MPETAEILNAPAWLPHSIDERRGIVEFVHLTREHHRAATFLDDAHLQPDVVRAEVPLAALQSADISPAATHFIFHSAFACSTLLTRALDIPGVAMGLKEPAILNHLTHLPCDEADVFLSQMMRLLGRPFGHGEKIIIKPSNVANPLIERMLAVSSDAHALLLHAPLADFLASIARKGMFGRTWVRRLFTHLNAVLPINTGYSDSEVFEQTDLQIAAMAWLIQHAQFAILAARYPARIRTLDSATFMNRKSEVLEALGQDFGLDIDASSARQIARGSVFARHAKEPGRAFDEGRRTREADAAKQVYAEEIDMVVTWTNAVAAHLGVPIVLPHRLLR